MTIDLHLIDELIETLNEEIDELTIDLERVRTQVGNYETQKKELELRLQDEEKIQQAYNNGNNDSHAAFSPYGQMESIEETSELKQREIELMRVQLDLTLEKLSAKQAECDFVMNQINLDIDRLTCVQEIGRNIKRQVDTYNNEIRVGQMKEMMQKKRLIQLEKTKYSPVVSKIESNVLNPLSDYEKQMKLAMNFISADPARAKMELEKSYKMLSDIIIKTQKMTAKLNYVEPDNALCDSLNSYVGDLTQIYPDIKFHITVANLKLINNINMDLNRCLMAFIRGLINSFILKCNPSMIYIRFAYEEGNLNVKGKVIGTYINFYNEMKASPTSIIANMYEKVFLLNGTIIFTDNKDGTFNVSATIPVKNYLA